MYILIERGFFMSFFVPVGISNHHVHLTQEVYEQLFDDDMVSVKPLKQRGEFASNLFVTLETEKGIIEDVRVLGPIRAYSQVEISSTDAYRLGLNPPVRKSGVLTEAVGITLKTNKGSVYLPHACILAENHIHMSMEDLKTYNVLDNEVVKVQIDKERKGTFYAHIKASQNGVLEFHVDRDEGSAFLLSNGDVLEVNKLDNSDF